MKERSKQLYLLNLFSRKFQEFWQILEEKNGNTANHITFLKKYLFIYLAAPHLRCSMQDLVPWPGIEPGPPAMGVRSLNHWTTRKSPDHLLMWLQNTLNKLHEKIMHCVQYSYCYKICWHSLYHISLTVRSKIFRNTEHSRYNINSRKKLEIHSHSSLLKNWNKCTARLFLFLKKRSFSQEASHSFFHCQMLKVDKIKFK